jgi:hypothetical protein
MAACLIMVPAITRATTITSGSISITGTVDQFAEWASVTNIAATDFSGHITGTNQTKTAHTDLTLYTNLDVTIAATAGTNSGILTDASSNTLVTAYDITSAAISVDPGMQAAAAFFNVANTYSLVHTAGTGSYTVRLTVSMSSPTNSAPDAGNYSCGLALTASF